MLVLMPVPDRDFDVTEVAVPWRMLTAAGHRVCFATESAGTVPAADPRLLTGVLFGRLGAADEPKRFYDQLTASPEFRDTSAWADLDPAGYDGLILPGGHAPGMRQYLGSEVLQEKVAQFWKLGQPVGAICHGVLVLARTKAPQTGRSVLADRRTTCLLKYQERGAYLLTAWRLGRYYRTYRAYVEDEVRAALASPEQFERGPRVLAARGTATTTPLPSSCRTAPTSQLAGPATRTCSPRPFSHSCSPDTGTMVTTAAGAAAHPWRRFESWTRPPGRRIRRATRGKSEHWLRHRRAPGHRG